MEGRINFRKIINGIHHVKIAKKESHMNLDKEHTTEDPHFPVWKLLQSNSAEDMVLLT